MGPTLALLEPWHAITLIGISCVALIVSLYCLLFTVPLRRFWQQVESLGGGLEGVKKHTESIKADVSRRLESVEEDVHKKVEKQTEDLQQETRELARRVEKKASALSTRLDQTREKMQELEKAIGGVQSRLEDGDRDREELERAVGKLSERIEDLESDFDSIDMELRESISRRVSESHKQVEARVLSALDAIQDQILGEAGGASAGPATESTGASGGRWHSPQEDPEGDEKGGPNIISAEPLFSHLEEGERGGEQDGGEDEEPEGEE